VSIWCLGLATVRRDVYDRFSMIGFANVHAPTAGISPFAIIAPTAR
jgi:hypothetical protein